MMRRYFMLKINELWRFDEEFSMKNWTSIVHCDSDHPIKKVKINHLNVIQSEYQRTSACQTVGILFGTGTSMGNPLSQIETSPTGTYLVRREPILVVFLEMDINLCAVLLEFRRSWILYTVLVQKKLDTLNFFSDIVKHLNLRPPWIICFFSFLRYRALGWAW
jgi:hypothetical protein